MLVNILRSFIGKIAAAVMIPLAAIGGFLTQPKTIVLTPPQQTATITSYITPPTPSSSLPISSSTTTTSIPPLPASSSQKQSSSTVPKDTTQTPPSSPQTTTTTKTATPTSTPSAKAVATKKTQVTPDTISAQWLSDNTTTSLRQKSDGTYLLTLKTDLGNTGNISWGLKDATIGGTGSIPRFDASTSCAPEPNLPSADLADQNPFFNVRTSYACTLSLTPQTGSDKRAQSKVFSFETGAGSLVVSVTNAMNTILKDGQNNGGFVFENQDSNPITISNITIDTSFTKLNTSTSPLVLRFVDSASDKTLFDYHMETLPADPTLPRTQGQKNANIPISFKIGPKTKKALWIQALGVSKINALDGINPAIHVAIRGVTTNQADTKTILRSATFTWTCVIPTTSYDPNATSGIFMSGEVCRD